MNKRVLVTGGFGFIGSHVLDALILCKDIDEIINIDYLGTGSNADLIPKFDGTVVSYISDISHESIKSIFEKHKPTHIIHLAAESHVDRSISNPMSFVQSNVVGTANILECARQYCDTNVKIVHVSTDEVYGHLEATDMPFIETHPLKPRSPYSASKAGSDMLALSYKTTYNMDITVTRCCNNYGPRQHDEKFIPTIIKSVITSKKIPVYGKGNNIREWIFVKDHVAALLDILFGAHKHSVYNIYGSSRQVNISLISFIVTQLLEKAPVYTRFDNTYIEHVDDRPGHDFCYKMSSIYNDIQSLNKQTDFKAGILETLDYYIKHYDISYCKTEIGS